FDCIQDFAHVIRLPPLFQIPSKPKSKLRFGYAHKIAAERNRGVVLQHALLQQPPGKRPIHCDVRLSCAACRRNLPPANSLPPYVREPRLDCITFRTICRSATFREILNSTRLLPGKPKHFCCELNVEFRHRRIMLLKLLCLLPGVTEC